MHTGGGKSRRWNRVVSQGCHVTMPWQSLDEPEMSHMCECVYRSTTKKNNSASILLLPEMHGQRSHSLWIAHTRSLTNTHAHTCTINGCIPCGSQLFA